MPADARHNRAYSLRRRLGRSPLGPPLYRGRELLADCKAIALDRVPKRQREVRRIGGELPLPPRSLRSKVIRNSDALNFIVSGDSHRRFICNTLLEADLNPLEMGSLLDFGCGCGRVLRYWEEMAPICKIHGSDYNPELTAWCEQNLPFAEISTNSLEPPLPLPADEFGLVYSISIFTHLPEEMQAGWMAELIRVTRPGGHLLLTFAGETYAELLDASEQERFGAGELIVRSPGSSGTNHCAVFHPRDYVERLIGDAELVSFTPGDPAKNMRQDAYLIRKP